MSMMSLIELKNQYLTVLIYAIPGQPEYSRYEGLKSVLSFHNKNISGM
jgi:hypothetical protein